MRTFAIGDIHGNLPALRQVLERAEFDYEHDTLIVLGDVVDYHLFSKDVIDLLLIITNKIVIKGNHDAWFLEWIETEDELPKQEWHQQGGKETLFSYDILKPTRLLNVKEQFPQTHISFLKKMKLFHIDAQNRVFVHAGLPLDGEEFKYKENYYWDRSLFLTAKMLSNDESKPKPEVFTRYAEIYIGHTVQQEVRPYLNVWNLDTGSGRYGKLTIMNIDTKEFWQSDSAEKLFYR